MREADLDLFKLATQPALLAQRMSVVLRLPPGDGGGGGCIGEGAERWRGLVCAKGAPEVSDKTHIRKDETASEASLLGWCAPRGRRR